MTNATVKPALERIETKLDSISKRLANLSPDCNPNTTESETLEESKE